ncbi:MAG: hypothetical protein ACI4J0_06145 [Huintestinicola sp.]|uniref:hypothetical protein n=1 Tax=Huintestinicola sp. TaxID=2981661 RepID=UPI003F0042F5
MKRSSAKLLALAAAAAMTISSAPFVSAAEYGWQEINGSKKYFMENDEYAKGIVVLDGVAHKFDSDGNYIGIYTGLAKLGKKTVFFDNGLLYRDGWLKIGSNTYYFYPDGAAAKGITEIDGKTYYFTSTGALKKEKASYEVTADKPVILSGQRETIRFTVTTDDISTEAYFGNIGAGSLHQFRNGKWYKVKPDSGYCIDDIAHILGNSKEYGTSTEKVTLTFTPEDYKLGLKTGLYRVEIPIYTNGRTVTKYCEFNIVEPAQVTTPRSEYYLTDTNEISFTVNVNSASQIYAREAIELFCKNEESGEWERVSPKDNVPASSASYEVTAGTSVTSKLDLSRYSKNKLKTGTYRASIGTGLSCEFKLIAPFECSAVQTETKSARNRQITMTIVNDTDRPVTLKGYGTLYRLENNKFKKVELKKGKKLDTELTVPAMTKWDKSFVLTDYYSLSSLKKGSYCIQLRDSSGFVKYAYFDLK